MVEARQERFVNRTGQFSPKPQKQWRLVTRLIRHVGIQQNEREASDVFWTPERQQLAQRAIEAINQELEPFGAPSLEFHPDQIKFVPQEEMWAKNARAQCNPWFGSFKVSYDYLDSDENFLEDTTHEYLHCSSLRLLQKDREGKLRWRRSGIQIYCKPLQGGISGDSVLFTDIDEGVIQITTKQILCRHFLLDRAIDWQGDLVVGMCEIISRVNKWCPSSDDVFRIFQTAAFGNGRLLELGRIIENTYGRGSLRTLGRLFKAIPHTDGYPNMFYSSEFRALMDFIVEPCAGFRR